MRAGIELFGREGVQAVTVRRIAEAANVSAPLVIHHFGSKEGLVEACDATVWSLVEAAMALLVEQGAAVDVQQFWAMKGMGEAIGYIGRSMQDDRPVGRRWFEQMLAMTVGGLGELALRGEARPTDDPLMRGLLLVSIDLGMVVLRPLVERALGAGLTEPAVLERWARAEFDLFHHGLFFGREGGT